MQSLIFAFQMFNSMFKLKNTIIIRKNRRTTNSNLFWTFRTINLNITMSSDESRERRKSEPKTDRAERENAKIDERDDRLIGDKS